MADADPNELVWMRKDDQYSPVPAYAVAVREESGWEQISKAAAKKAGYALPADAAADTTATTPTKSTPAKEG